MIYSRLVTGFRLLLIASVAYAAPLYSLQPQAPSATAATESSGPNFSVPDSALHNPATIIVYGDMRFTDPSNTKDANPSARKLLVAKIAAEHPDAVQLTGDVPLAGGNTADYDEYRIETEAWRSASLHVYPVLGNHEFANGHKPCPECIDHWWAAFPDFRGLRWYSVALGSRIYIISLDSNSDLVDGSPQRAWLKDQLDHLSKSVDFVLIGLHHPPVADIQTRIEVSHNPRPNEIALRDYLSSATPKMHASIVVTGGHIHNYERFLVDGVTYLVSGGGGARPYEVDRTPPDLYQNTDFPNFHYVKFALEKNQLSATMFRLADPQAATPEWQSRDSFAIKKK
jgi:hypothetical protein